MVGKKHTLNWIKSYGEYFEQCVTFPLGSIRMTGSAGGAGQTSCMEKIYEYDNGSCERIERTLFLEVRVRPKSDGK